MEFDNITFELPKDKTAPIKVIGVGGGGSNAVNYMYEEGIGGVDFIVCNTDAQALNNSNVPIKIQLGASITEGLGAGANPEVGEQAALESIDDIKVFLDSNTKMVFVTAGMGGGTGTGAAPVIANTAKELGILTVGIVTAPFNFEGKMRLEQAKKGIERLRNHVDSLIIINNDKLRELYGNLGYRAGFAKADEVLATAAKGIAEVITYHYDTNIDLRDAKTVLADSGTAIMGSASASGEDKAEQAIKKALDSPLLNDNMITGAKNVLLLIVSGEDEITMDEVRYINEYIQEEANRNANIIMGIGTDMEIGDSISVTVIATGFPHDQQDYNGQENQNVIHVLDEDQPVTKTLDIEKPLPDLPSNQNLKSEEKKIDENLGATTNSLNNIESKSKVQPVAGKPLHLDIEEETTDELISVNQSVQNASVEKDLPSSKSTPLEEKNQVTQPKSEDNFTVFTLDDDEDSQEPSNFMANREPKPKADSFAKKAETVKDTQPAVQEDAVEVNPFDKPISETVSKQIEERKARLKKFNYTFRQNIQNVEEVESEPAFRRQGINLNEAPKTNRGSYKLENDQNGDLKIRPNNFLHDNVD